MRAGESSSSSFPEARNRRRKRRVRKEEKLRRKSDQKDSLEQDQASSLSQDSARSSSSSGPSRSEISDPSSPYIDVDLPPSPAPPKQPLAASLLTQEELPGFIRVRSGPSRGRKGAGMDPVRLHQMYEECWAKSNIPGEKSHSKLRWAVRGWMMREEPV